MLPDADAMGSQAKLEVLAEVLLGAEIKAEHLPGAKCLLQVGLKQRRCRAVERKQAMARAAWRWGGLWPPASGPRRAREAHMVLIDAAELDWQLGGNDSKLNPLLMR